MNILWLCNKAPRIILDYDENIAGNSYGGWLDDMCRRLVEDSSVELCVCFPSRREISGAFGNLRYHSFSESSCCEIFRQVVSEFSPDVIHIWGTEYRHSRVMTDVCMQKNIIDRVVISIQGLVSICGKVHYCEGLPLHVVHAFTLRDFLRRDNIRMAQKRFIRSGMDEIQALKNVRHVIGRTDWDRAVSGIYNPNAEYYFCNESLRDSFYERSWKSENMEKHSIFVSQCSYPIKGFHYMLEALVEILKRYPDAILYTTGKNLLDLSIKDRLLLNSYQVYILKLIHRYDLSDHVVFLGHLTEAEMCERYLKSNVFVSASTIENSPNSVGEAMILGCPVVASDVGGVKNMLEHGKEGFVYQSTAPYMLAYYVCNVFADEDKTVKMSCNARVHAMHTHDRDMNFNRIMNIYEKVNGGGYEFLEFSCYSFGGIAC